MLNSLGERSEFVFNFALRCSAFARLPENRVEKSADTSPWHAIARILLR
jgi:hypothetical protein